MNNPFKPQREDPQPRQDSWFVLAAIAIMVVAAAIELWRSSKNRLLRVPPQNALPPAPHTAVDSPIIQQNQPAPAAPITAPIVSSTSAAMPLPESLQPQTTAGPVRPPLPTIKFSDRWLIYLMMATAVAALLLNTPTDLLLPLIVVLVIWASIWAVTQRVTPEGVIIDGGALVDAPAARKVRMFSRTRILTLALYAVEISAIVAAGAWVTESYLRNEPNERMTGGEQEWITSSAYFGAKALQQYGYIPLWDPFWEYGRPLIENPVSFITNPFSFIPSVLYGGTQGIKVSAAITVILAGLGGWTLGRALGLGTLGRVLLAMLLIGKGGMIGMMREGYFQLGGSQAYIPWVMAGLLLTMRTRSRWPIVLTALSFTMLFFAGNLWFTLPTLILMGLLVLSHIFMGDNAARRERLQRLVLAGVLTITLSMVILLPAGLNFNRIGNHPEENGGGWNADMGDVFRLYTEPLVDVRFANETISTWSYFGHIYISYVTPIWLLLLLFLLLPPATRFLYRPALRDDWRIWAVGIIMIAFCTLWGAGRLGLLYEYIPPLRQWRFVGRALAVGAFWIAVLIAMRADGLWRALLPSGEKITANPRFALRGALAVGLAAVCFYAAYNVMLESKDEVHVEARNETDSVCIRWLAEQHPNEEIAIYRVGYEVASVFVDSDVRLSEVAADFGIAPMDNTIGNFQMPSTYIAPYAVGLLGSQREHMRAVGYTVIPESPRIFGPEPCAFRFTAGPVLGYAFSAPIPALEAASAAGDQLPSELTTPITAVERHYDKIALRVTADTSDPLAVVLQEVSYPGWRVWIDGTPADLEVVAGLIGVTLPADGAEHYVYFQYIPTLFIIGGYVTVAAALFCIAYLLRLDRFIPERLKARMRRLWAAFGQRLSNWQSDDDETETQAPSET